MEQTRDGDVGQVYRHLRMARKELLRWVQAPTPRTPYQVGAVRSYIDELLRVLDSIMPSLADKGQQAAASSRNHRARV